MYYRLYTFLLIFLIACVSCRPSEERREAEGEETGQRETGIPKATADQDSVPLPQQNPKRVPSAGKIETDTILGAWLRPDGNYILEFTAINDDNSLVANYYNPRPINIAMAQVKREDRIKIYVEFDDANYRGSYYDLQYDPVNDALTGNYYQATYGQTYSIAFIRYDDSQP